MPFCNQCGAAEPGRVTVLRRLRAAARRARRPQRRRARKTVTIVFSDIAGSTDMGERLDPESISSVMRRYAER